MAAPHCRRPLVASLALLAATACAAADGPRYGLAADPGSRQRSKHVLEKRSRLWTHLQCELRVGVERRLPDPLSDPARGDLLHFTAFGRLSMGTAGIVPAEHVVRDGHRVWLWRRLAGEDDLRGRAGLGVQAEWPTGGDGPSDYEPMEVFALPPLGTLVPDVWSPWRRADETRGGLFAGWEKLHGSAADPGLADAPPPVGEVPPIPHPYELRCRAVLADRLFTPLESEDPNVGKPDPSTATREEGAGAAG